MTVVFPNGREYERRVAVHHGEVVQSEWLIDGEEVGKADFFERLRKDESKFGITINKGTLTTSVATLAAREER